MHLRGSDFPELRDNGSCMARELPVGEAWQEHVVVTQTLSGQVLFRVEVRKRECESSKKSPAAPAP